MSWQPLLQHEVAASGCVATARKLGISHTSVSLLLAGKYPGNTTRMARRISTVLAPDRAVACPFTGEEITILECAKISALVPTSSPVALRHWKMCRTCAHNPHKKEQQQ